MSRAGNSLRAEQMKLWSKKSAFRSILIIALLTAVVSLICVSLRGSEAYRSIGILGGIHGIDGLEQTDNAQSWTSGLRERISELSDIRQSAAKIRNSSAGIKKGIAERMYAKAQWEETIKRYRLDNGIGPKQDDPWELAVLSLWLMLPIIAVFSAVFVSDIFAGEFERGTVRLIFSRPMTRSKIYSAKVICSLMYSILLTAVAFCVGVGVGVVSFGADLNGTYMGCRGDEVYQISAAKYALLMLMCSCAIIAVCVFFCGFMGCLTRSRTVSISAVAALAIGGVYCGDFFGSLGGKVIGLNILSCIDLTVAAAGLPNCADLSFWTCLVSAAMHSIAFLSFGYRAFRRDV